VMAEHTSCSVLAGSAIDPGPCVCLITTLSLPTGALMGVWVGPPASTSLMRSCMRPPCCRSSPP
jgi:hypothetical protein